MVPSDKQPNQLQFNLDDVPADANMARRTNPPPAIVVRVRSPYKNKNSQKPGIVVKEILNTPLSPNLTRPYAPVHRPSSPVHDDPAFQFTAVSPQKLSTAIILAQRDLKRMKFEDKLKLLANDPTALDDKTDQGGAGKSKEPRGSTAGAGRPSSARTTIVFEPSKKSASRPSSTNGRRPAPNGGRRRKDGRSVREKPRNRAGVESESQTPSIHSKVTQTDKDKAMQTQSRTNLAFHLSDFDLLPAFGTSPPTRDGDHYKPVYTGQAKHGDEIRFLRKRIKQYVEEIAKLESRMIENDEVRMKGLRKGDEDEWFDEDDPVRKARRMKERHVRSTRMLYFLQKQVRDIQKELRRCRDTPIKHTKKSQAIAKLAAAHRGAARAMQTFLQFLPEQDTGDGMPTMYTDLAILIRELSICCAQLDIAGAGMNDELMRTIIPTVKAISDSWLDEKSRVLSPYLRKLLEKQSDVRGPRDPPPKKELFPEFDNRINIPIERDMVRVPCSCYSRKTMADNIVDRDLEGFKYRRVVRNKGVQVKRPTAVLKKKTKKPWVRLWSRTMHKPYDPPPVEERKRIKRLNVSKTRRYRSKLKAREGCQPRGGYSAPTVSSRHKIQSLKPIRVQYPGGQEVITPRQRSPRIEGGQEVIIPRQRSPRVERGKAWASPGSSRPSSPRSVLTEASIDSHRTKALNNFKEKLEKVKKLEVASTVEQLRMEFDKKAETLLKNAEKTINKRLKPVLDKAQGIMDQEAELKRHTQQSLRTQLSKQMADKVQVNADIISDMILEDMCGDTVRELNRIDREVAAEADARQAVAQPTAAVVVDRIGDMQRELDNILHKYSTVRYEDARDGFVCARGRTRDARDGFVCARATTPDAILRYPYTRTPRNKYALGDWTCAGTWWPSPKYSRRIGDYSYLDKYMYMSTPSKKKGGKTSTPRSSQAESDSERERTKSLKEGHIYFDEPDDIVHVSSEELGGATVHPHEGERGSKGSRASSASNKDNLIEPMDDGEEEEFIVIKPPHERRVHSEVYPPDQLPMIKIQKRGSDYEKLTPNQLERTPTLSNVDLLIQRYAYATPDKSAQHASKKRTPKPKQRVRTGSLGGSDAPPGIVKNWFDQSKDQPSPNVLNPSDFTSDSESHDEGKPKLQPTATDPSTALQRELKQMLNSRYVPPAYPPDSGPLTTALSPSLSEEIDRYCEEYDSYLKKAGHWIVGKFDPWKLAEFIADDLIEECIADIGDELESIETEIVDTLYKSEFMSPDHSSHSGPRESTNELKTPPSPMGKPTKDKTKSKKTSSRLFKLGCLSDMTISEEESEEEKTKKNKIAGKGSNRPEFPKNNSNSEETKTSSQGGRCSTTTTSSLQSSRANTLRKSDLSSLKDSSRHSVKKSERLTDHESLSKDTDCSLSANESYSSFSK